MDLTAESIDKILGLAGKAVSRIHEHNGEKYSTIPLHRIKGVEEYQFELLVQHTLQGFHEMAEILDGEFPNDRLIARVKSQSLVVLEMQGYNKERKVRHLAQVRPAEFDEFPYGKWLDPEPFSIGLMTRFVQTDELGDLLKIMSRLTAENISMSEDDGVSQKVTVKSGVATMSQATINPFVTLAPYRTFLEIEQPASPFLFRLKQDGGKILCALFEADGGRWKIAAMSRIQQWLQGEFGDTGITVIL